jgi:glycosyltransferase involved in cell wall biosynthesis
MDPPMIPWKSAENLWANTHAGGGQFQARIEIISQVNKGVSSARNTGISHSKGEYIVFVDPDDEVDTNLIKKLDEKISTYKNKPDLVIWGYWCINMASSNNENGRHMVLPQKSYELFSNQEIMKELFPRYIGYSVDQVSHWAKYGTFEPKHEWGACWRVAYRRALLIEHDVHFNEQIVLNEDSMFNANVLVYACSVVTIPEALYFYYIRNTGALKKGLTNSIIKNKMALFSERKRIVDLSQKSGNNMDIGVYVGSIIFGIIELMNSSSKGEWGMISNLLRDPHVKQCIRYMPYVQNAKFSLCLFFLKNHCSFCLFTLIQLLKRLGIRLSV